MAPFRIRIAAGAPLLQKLQGPWEARLAAIGQSYNQIADYYLASGLRRFAISVPPSCAASQLTALTGVNLQDADSGSPGRKARRTGTIKVL